MVVQEEGAECCLEVNVKGQMLEVRWDELKGPSDISDVELLSALNIAT